MKHFYLYDASGQIFMAGHCADEDFERQASGQLLLGEGVASVSSDYFDGTCVVPKPARPSRNHIFDWSTKTWQDPRTLADLKAAKWQEIKAERAAAEFSGFAWDSSAFDSDSVSQARLQGALQLAGMVPDFAIDWTLQDNTVRTLSAADLAGVGMALGQHVAAQHEKARSLRQQIEAAATAEALAAIGW